MCTLYEFQTRVVEEAKTSLINLLQSGPTLTDQVPSLGYIPRLCEILRSNSSPQASSTILRVLHQLSLSDVSVAAI